MQRMGVCARGNQVGTTRTHPEQGAETEKSEDNKKGVHTRRRVE
jgi:hypothetical protein